jgi:hypothetical protein
MNGGVSQFETFDMKPGRPTGGVFRPISTCLPGTQVCELMPNMAQHLDKVSVIRSMRTSQVDHPGGIYLMHTGYQPTPNVRFPEIGAIAAKYLAGGSELPEFIKVSSQGNAGSGFLGPQYQPLLLNADGRLPPFSSARLSGEEEKRQHELISFVEDQFAKRNPSENSKMHREAYAAARECPQCLRHRRRVAEVSGAVRRQWLRSQSDAGPKDGREGCTVHRDRAERLRHARGQLHGPQGACAADGEGVVRATDRSAAARPAGKNARHLDGRNRSYTANQQSLRPRPLRPQLEHRAGRLKGGFVYGASDEDGIDVKENNVTGGDLFATIYKALGIDPETENYAGVRPIPLPPFGSKVVEDLLA